MIKKYTDAESLRTALETRILSSSKKEGVDIYRLRRDVAFDRLLVRLFQMSSPPWALKGGYAMQLRTDNARTTKDVDLALKEAKLFSEDPDKRIQAIRDLLIQQANLDLGDFFTFLISQPIGANTAPEGGTRFKVTANLSDRKFEDFSIDVGMGDVWSDPLDELNSSDILEFAGFKSQKLLAISKEQQFAEKLHAYTMPRKDGRENSRVKDLIDMNLLIDASLDNKKLLQCLKTTFERRNTHELDLNINEPPKLWIEPYAQLAEECGLNMDINVGFKQLEIYLKKVKQEM